MLAFRPCNLWGQQVSRCEPRYPAKDRPFPRNGRSTHIGLLAFGRHPSWPQIQSSAEKPLTTS